MMNLDENQGVDGVSVSDDTSVAAPIDANGEDVISEEAEKAFDPDSIELEEADIEKEEEPDIPLPKFWKEDKKDAWAALPKSAKEEVARQIAESASYATRKETEAKHARADAYKEAQTAYVQELQANAWTLEQLFPPPQVVQPDQSLLYGDANEQALYHRQKAQADAMMDSHQQVGSRIADMRAQAQAIETAHEQQERQATAQEIIEIFPELADGQSEAAQGLLNRLENAALKAGYPREILSDAGPADFKAFKYVADLIDENAKLKADSDKLNELRNKAKMKFARSFKKTPGQVPGQSSQSNGAEGDPNLERQKALYPSLFGRA
jgi:hypothetical protein